MTNKYLSANAIFHFTDDIENIINILHNEFSPQYCMESFAVLGKDKLETAIPMVCFCDIQLSQIRNHIENYGGYAIGLTKEWGISNGINPVMYSTKSAISTKTIRSILDKLNDISEDKNIEEKELKLLLQQYIFFIKPYDGLAWNEKEFDGKYTRFYDEREWRYIPEFDLLKDNNIRLWLTKEEYLNEKLKEENNHKISELVKIHFNPNDIKYIIVNSDEEILNLCDAIDTIKGDKDIQKQLKILKTRIISKEQILSDF